MNFAKGSLGWIEVVCGPMFSGKSEELIRRLRRSQIARKRVQVFKPVLDDRYSRDEIVSHGDQRMKSEVVNSAKEILERSSTGGHQVVGVDEVELLRAGLGGDCDSPRGRRQAGDCGWLGYGFYGASLSSHAGFAVPGGVDHQDAGHLHALRESGEAYAAAGGVRGFDCGGRGGDV